MAPIPRTGIGVARQTRPLSLLLVEDDRGDALIVEELVAEANIDIEMAWAPTMADADREITRLRPDCILLDLNLPDANGIAALDHVSKHDPNIPIVVLTGLNDEPFGVSALASGAQDYLVKGRVESEMLRRALLYAIERKRAEITAAHLWASEHRAQENSRLERGLLPSPLLLENPGVDIVAQYRPTRESALLGGDFYDFVQTSDRTLHVMVGDVGRARSRRGGAGRGPANRLACTDLRRPPRA